MGMQQTKLLGEGRNFPANSVGLCNISVDELLGLISSTSGESTTGVSLDLAWAAGCCVQVLSWCLLMRLWVISYSPVGGSKSQPCVLAAINDSNTWDFTESTIVSRIKEGTVWHSLDSVWNTASSFRSWQYQKTWASPAGGHWDGQGMEQLTKWPARRGWGNRAWLARRGSFRGTYQQPSHIYVCM